MSQAGIPAGIWEAFGAVREKENNFALIETPEGEILSLKRRILPGPSTMTLKKEIEVREGMRPDLVAWEQLGSSAAYTKIADINAVLSPFELTNEPGKIIKIPE